MASFWVGIYLGVAWGQDCDSRDDPSECDGGTLCTSCEVGSGKAYDNVEDAYYCTAADGAEVVVYKGTYTDDIDLECGYSVTIRGSTKDPDDVVLAGGGGPHLVYLDSGGHVTFEDLTVDAEGERRTFGSDGTDLTLDNVVVVNGVGQGDQFDTGELRPGGALWIRDAALTISDSSFGAAQASSGTCGGHVALLSASADITDTSFDAGSADCGGSIYVETSSLVGGRVALDGVDIANSAATAGDGGAIYAILTTNIVILPPEPPVVLGSEEVEVVEVVVSKKASLALTSSTLYNNSASDNGGAVFSDSVSVTLTDVTVDTNVASGGDGGGVYVAGTALSVTDSRLVSNVADSGGAITCEASTGCDLTDTWVRDNVASGDGGAVYATGSGLGADEVVVDLLRGWYCNNQGAEGGAVYAIDALTRARNVGFVFNDGGAKGGALKVKDSDLQAVNSHFVGNYTTNNGGAIDLANALATLTNNLFLQNSSNNHAIHGDDGAHSIAYNLFFENSPQHSSIALDQTNQVDVDPLLRGPSPSACDELDPVAGGSTDALFLTWDSPARDAGTGLDPDSTDADLGVWGGADMDTAALDNGDADDAQVRYDCDDEDAERDPVDPEVCDDGNVVDEDCDDWIDDADTNTQGEPIGQDYVYPDGDGDGAGLYGTTPGFGCLADGWSTNDDDCDDTDGIPGNNGGPWYWDGDLDGEGAGAADRSCEKPEGYVDNDLDCDDAADDLNSSTVWYQDHDQDTYGNADLTLVQCDVSAEPEPYTRPDDTDCDDQDPEVGPPSTQYVDQDGDGYGVTSTATTRCPALGWAAVGGDCNDGDETLNPATTWYQDLDGDEWGSEVSQQSCMDPGKQWIETTGDCDDAQAEINPETTWYQDGDGDGYGNDDVTVTQCDAPDDHVLVGGDCDDTDEDVTPGSVCWMPDGDGDGLYDPNGAEVCQCDPPDGYVSSAGSADCNDDNPDPDASAPVWTVDADGDGYGAEGGAQIVDPDQCIRPEGYADNDDDCDDVLAEINPGTKWYQDADLDEYGDDASETVQCEAPDDGWILVGGDCDDGDYTSTPETVCWLPDGDEDGRYDPNGAHVCQCVAPDGHVALDAGEDCNDDQPLAWTNAPEVCDGVDNDCDGEVDTSVTYYQDADEDGYGAPGTGQVFPSCDEKPAGWVANDLDCNDALPHVRPNQPEECDTFDNDCDDLNDEDGVCDTGECLSTALPEVTLLVCFESLSRDDAASACEDRAYSLASAVDPAVEQAIRDLADDASVWIGDGTCMLSTSNGSTEADCAELHGYACSFACVSGDYFLDADADGFGDPEVGVSTCDPGDWYVVIDADHPEDCDDSEPAVHPVPPGQYADLDGDGWLGEDSLCGDEATFATTPVEWDCNDDAGDPAALTENPGAKEHCDARDNNCNDDVDGKDGEDEMDADSLNVSHYWVDADGDGVGGSDLEVYACSKPAGTAVSHDDCYDDDPANFPKNDEVCDGQDNDCDDLVDTADDIVGGWSYYADADGDGYGAEDAAPTASCSAVAPQGYAATQDDCDDGQKSVHPGADELCNDLDDDCDGGADEEAVTDAAYQEWACYVDADGDGDPADAEHGEPDTSVWACTRPSDCGVEGTDCDDSSSSVYWGAVEFCNGISDDCDEELDEDALDAVFWDYFADEDGDGAAGTETFVEDPTCDRPEDLPTEGPDCDDSNVDVGPGFEELCDGLDNDCDPTTSEDDATEGPDLVTWYADADGDGYGDAAATAVACGDDPPASCAAIACVTVAGDCGDDHAGVHPGATEYCNELDDDCDEVVDEGVDARVFYEDADGDGFGNLSNKVESCFQPEGFVTNPDDCNDTEAAINPDAAEVWENDVDENCDGNTADQDGDGVTRDNDCDDLDAGVNPGSTDVPNDGIDQNCDHVSIQVVFATTECGCGSRPDPAGWGLVGLALAAALRTRRSRR